MSELRSNSNFHIPVLVSQVCGFLLQAETRLIADVTLGDGGHSEALLKNGGEGLKIIGIDQDREALRRAEQRLAAFKDRIEFIAGNFADLAWLLQGRGIYHVDGILADLGTSLHQISSPDRGFSFMVDGPLKMVMNPEAQKNAYDLVNRAECAQLQQIFFQYGEERFAKKIARTICSERQRRPIETTAHLAALVRQCVAAKHAIKSVARIFQAIRIAVNDELNSLEKFLPQALNALAVAGRLAIISYHSLEDRMVKAFMRTQANPCTCPPEFAVCVCGKRAALSLITRHAVTPTPEEVAQNSRARSAKLRVAEKMAI